MTSINGNAVNGLSETKPSIEFEETFIVNCLCDDGVITVKYKWFFEKPSMTVLLRNPLVGIRTIEHTPVICSKGFAHASSREIAQFVLRKHNERF